jgi:hypothetical protein
VLPAAGGACGGPVVGHARPDVAPGPPGAVVGRVGTERPVPATPMPYLCPAQHVLHSTATRGRAVQRQRRKVDRHAVCRMAGRAQQLHGAQGAARRRTAHHWRPAQQAPGPPHCTPGPAGAGSGRQHHAPSLHACDAHVPLPLPSPALPRQAGWVVHAVELFRRQSAAHGPQDQREYTTLISRLLKVCGPPCPGPHHAPAHCPCSTLPLHSTARGLCYPCTLPLHTGPPRCSSPLTCTPSRTPARPATPYLCATQLPLPFPSHPPTPPTPPTTS